MYYSHSRYVQLLDFAHLDVIFGLSLCMCKKISLNRVHAPFVLHQRRLLIKVQVSIAECSKKVMGTGVELVEAGNGKHGVRPSLFADEKGLI